MTYVFGMSITVHRDVVSVAIATHDLCPSTVCLEKFMAIMNIWQEGDGGEDDGAAGAVDAGDRVGAYGGAGAAGEMMRLDTRSGAYAYDDGTEDLLGFDARDSVDSPRPIVALKGAIAGDPFSDCVALEEAAYPPAPPALPPPDDKPALEAPLAAHTAAGTAADFRVPVETALLFDSSDGPEGLPVTAASALAGATIAAYRLGVLFEDDVLRVTLVKAEYKKSQGRLTLSVESLLDPADVFALPLENLRMAAGPGDAPAAALRLFLQTMPPLALTPGGAFRACCLLECMQPFAGPSWWCASVSGPTNGSRACPSP